MKRLIRTVFTPIFSLFPIKRNKIVFCNFNGKGYGCNPKYIAEAIHKKCDSCKIVWLCTKKTLDLKFPEYVTPVKIGSIKGIYEVLTAKAVVRNVRNSLKCPKRDGQIYLQTWHGGWGPKRVEAEVEDSLSPSYVSEAKDDGAKTDAVVVCCELQLRQFMQHFWFRPDVEYLCVGLPRNDRLIKNQDSHRELELLREQIVGGTASKVILYVPTFRENCSVEKLMPDLEQLIKICSEKFSGNWKVLVRVHPNSKISFPEGALNTNIIDVSSHPDIQELYSIANILITDYSSAVYDFSLLDRPIFIHAPDMNQYNASGRLSKDFFDLPFPIAATSADLYRNITDFDSKEYSLRVKTYRNSHPSYDNGTASEETASWLLNKLYQ